MNETMISAAGLAKAFGTNEVLRGVDFSVGRGEVVSVIGPSGSGKSTMLRCLIGLERVSGGSIFINGAPLVDNGVYAREKDARLICSGMGMVFQHFNLFPHMSVRKNLTSAPLCSKKLKKAEANERAAELLGKVGLADKIDEMPSSLSGGQKQRVAIAGMLAMHPEVLVLDEATAMLDPSGRGEVLSTVTRLNQEDGMTVVMITQYMEEAVGCDRIAVMANGKLALLGTPYEIFSQADRLHALGLDVPIMIAMREKLKKRGLPITGDPMDCKELGRAICQLLSNI